MMEDPMRLLNLVTDEMNDWIARLPLEDEIHRVACALAPDKSPGTEASMVGFTILSSL